MNDLIAFAFEGSAAVRSMLIEGKPWFVAADACRVLEIRNARDAAKRLDADQKGVVITDTLGGPQEITIISQSGLVELVFASRKPKARKFTRWIVDEVVPILMARDMRTIERRPSPQLALPSNFMQRLPTPETSDRVRKPWSEEHRARWLALPRAERIETLFHMFPPGWFGSPSVWLEALDRGGF